jgi:hypothetical protein
LTLLLSDRAHLAHPWQQENEAFVDVDLDMVRQASIVEPPAAHRVVTPHPLQPRVGEAHRTNPIGVFVKHLNGVQCEWRQVAEPIIISIVESILGILGLHDALDGWDTSLKQTGIGLFMSIL